MRTSDEETMVLGELSVAVFDEAERTNADSSRLATCAVTYLMWRDPKTLMTTAQRVTRTRGVS